jgi:hypothetical protein
MNDNVKIIHGDFNDNDYLLIEEDGRYLIVHTDYFTQESAVLFELAFYVSDWSEGMIIDGAKKVVDHLNSIGFYPSQSF